MDIISRLQTGSMVEQYNVHIFVFFLTLFMALTLTYPAIFLNDEFLTANQLHQLHDGHQIVVNEGKYGLLQNGSLSGYLSYKGNVLAYPLFLPLLSLPAFWILDLTGDHFVFFILILWTISALVLIFFIHNIFKQYSCIGSWRWTPLATGGIFMLFFLNLYFYKSFPAGDKLSNFPEVIAIVFINVLLLSVAAVIIYEINHTIFPDPAYAFFGTLVCLFSSSCFLWATFCKDHTLVLTLFVAIFLSLVRFISTDEYWYLPLAFLLCGTFAWIRPELAFWTTLVVIAVFCFTLVRYRSETKPGYPLPAVICSPVFTAVGALPFLLNNYLITKNFFMPPQAVYLPDTLAALTADIPFTGVKTPGAAILMFLPAIPASPWMMLMDLFGILFYPKNGGLSVSAVVPLALVMVVLAGVLLSVKKIQFSQKETGYISLIVLLVSAVFLTYFNMIHFLNTDTGQVPDIRYLLAFYVPLTILGLIILKKTGILPENIREVFGQLVITGIAGLSLTLIFLPVYYIWNFRNTMTFLPVGKFYSVYTLALVILTLGSLLYYQRFSSGKEIARYLVLLLCLVPFFWQIDVTVMFASFSHYTGYIYWIPLSNVVRDVFFMTGQFFL